MLLAYLTAAAIIAALAAGGLGGLALGRLAAARMFRQRLNRSALRRSGLVGAAFAALPSLLISFVVGGNFGGSWGQMLIGGFGVPVGLFAGISVVLALGTGAGYWVGAYFAALDSKTHNP